jgi:phage terminase large subunit-like protein
MSTIAMGVTVRDRITGFTGVVIGRTEYISGCDQALVQPQAKPDGEYVEGRWFDQQRLEVVDAAPVTLENGTTPGGDIPAPVR